MNGQKELGKTADEEFGKGIETDIGIRGNQIEEIVALQDELKISMEKILGWTDKKFAAKKLEELSKDQAEAVISVLKATKEKREREKEKAEEATEKEKVIDIAWHDIPKQTLIPKLKKSLEYYYEIDSETGKFLVKKKSGEGKTHKTTSSSCDCGDWINRGNSLNPCTHMIRRWYSDEEIQEILKEFGADNLLPMKRKTQKDIAVQEPSIESDMMIRGLIPRLAETGKIKIGTLSDKIVSGRRLPKKLDHFVVTSLLRDENGDLMIDEEMAKKIGNSCQELPIYLCYDDPSLNFTTFYGYFTQSRLRCMGNGITASRTLESGDKEEIACNPKTCEAYKNKQCKPYGRLSVILADASRVGGCHILRTTSWNSIRNILTSMAFIKTITGGIIAGIKLKLTLIPMQVQPRDLGRTVKIYTVNIEYGGSWDQLKDVAAKEMQRRVQLGTNMKQIESGDREMIAEQVKTEAEEQAAEISQEFAPEPETEE